MTKTRAITVTVVLDEARDLDDVADLLAEASSGYAGVVTYAPWSADPQGAGSPAAASNGSERGFDSPPGV